MNLNSKDAWTGSMIVAFLWGLTATIEMIKLLYSSSVSADVLFTINVVNRTLFLAGVVCGAYLLNKMFTTSIQLREPNEAETASHQAELNIVWWLYGVVTAGLFMAVTEATIRAHEAPTVFMQYVRKATVIIFVVLVIGTQAMLRHLGRDLIRREPTYKRNFTTATIMLVLCAVTTLIASNLPDAGRETVGEGVTKAVSFFQLLFFVVGAVFGVLGVWQLKRERAGGQGQLNS
jgi:hypothetical protein